MGGGRARKVAEVEVHVGLQTRVHTDDLLAVSKLEMPWRPLLRGGAKLAAWCQGRGEEEEYNQSTMKGSATTRTRRVT